MRILLLLLLAVALVEAHLLSRQGQPETARSRSRSREVRRWMKSRRSSIESKGSKASFCNGKRRTTLAIATLALGMALFALFFGLVAACDQL